MSTATLDKLAGLPTKAELRLAKRWIPKDATEHPHALGVVYTQDAERKGRPCFLALAFVGTAAKSAFYEGFMNREGRDKRVAEFFAGLESSEARKATRKQERERPHTLQAGDIIHHSWGWEQTNCDYYQIISVTAHGATIAAIRGATVPESTYSHGMAEMLTPVKDGFCGEPFKVRIDGHNYVTSLEHGCASKWDGRPDYHSWYA